jgi:hypothetical protein
LSSEIFTGPVLNSLQRFFDVLDRVGDAEAKVSTNAICAPIRVGFETYTYAECRSNTNFGVLKSAEDSGRYSLQIFLCPGIDTIECFFDVLDRVRHTEAKISLAEVPERGT